VISKLEVYFLVIGDGLPSCHVILQTSICKRVLYSIRELFSFHLLKCFLNLIVYRKARVVRDDILVIVFYSLV
jgi:hypothetical protein